MKPRTCVTPHGCFVYGIHQPAFSAANLRVADAVQPLGAFVNGEVCDNQRNFPVADVEEAAADWVFEIPNAFPFRGTTYVGRAWADRTAQNPAANFLPQAAAVSMTEFLAEFAGGDRRKLRKAFCRLPEPVLLALAVTSTDSRDLVELARLACEFVYDSRSRKKPQGLRWEQDSRGRVRPMIRQHDLFEVVANNRHLPDAYKEAMVLRPGAQGQSEIVGEWRTPATHVFEYLRRNSYIPWGHYAANMADDAVRYRAADLLPADMAGLRHLYCQRTYVRLAALLGVELPGRRQTLSTAALEQLRRHVLAALAARPAAPALQFDATLWGWNYGFDFAPSGYRLHASHQQIHQQYAMLPATVTAFRSDGAGDSSGEMASYGCGDLIAAFIDDYRRAYGSDFFDDYVRAIRTNQRLDNDRQRDCSLIVYEDRHVMLFVPKAQTSQWELQLMTMGPVGNILEADIEVRAAIDHGLLIAIRILAGLGAAMVTTIEYPKRFTAGNNGQKLLYSLLPRLPQSPGAFSEAQLRFVMGHYPEDFASACRAKFESFPEPR